MIIQHHLCDKCSKHDVCSLKERYEKVQNYLQESKTAIINEIGILESEVDDIKLYSDPNFEIELRCKHYLYHQTVKTPQLRIPDSWQQNTCIG